MLNIDEIRTVTAKAFRGPWDHIPNDRHGRSIFCGIGTHPIIIANTSSKEDAEFICRARWWVPALCDEVERIDAEMHKAVDECNRWADKAYKAEEERDVLKRALELEVEESYGKPAPQEIIDEVMKEAQKNG